MAKYNWKDKRRRNHYGSMGSKIMRFDTTPDSNQMITINGDNISLSGGSYTMSWTGGSANGTQWLTIPEGQTEEVLIPATNTLGYLDTNVSLSGTAVYEGVLADLMRDNNSETRVGQHGN